MADAVVRCGRKGYLKKLEAFVKDLINGVFSNEKVSNTELMDLAEHLCFLEHGLQLSEYDLIKRERQEISCLLYTSLSPRDQRGSRMPSSA